MMNNSLLIGMYGETPQVQVGKYTICRQDTDSVWIQNDQDEGAQFSDDLLEKFLDYFFAEHF